MIYTYIYIYIYVYIYIPIVRLWNIYIITTASYCFVSSYAICQHSIHFIKKIRYIIRFHPIRYCRCLVFTKAKLLILAKKLLKHMLINTGVTTKQFIFLSQTFKILFVSNYGIALIRQHSFICLLGKRHKTKGIKQHRQSWGLCSYCHIYR